MSLNQKGIAHLLLTLLLLAGIGLGVYLVGQRTNIFPWAASNPISGPITSPSPVPMPSAGTGFVRVISPNGGEVLTNGTTVDISWEGNVANYTLNLVDVDYPQNPGWITTTYNANQKSYSWNINTLPGKYKIRVITYPGDGTSISDDSDAFFTIVNAPIVSPSPSPTPTPTAFPSPSSTPAPSPSTLPLTFRGEYFSNLNLTGQPKIIRNDNAINFNWGFSAPVGGIPRDNFSVRWTRPENFAGGRYEFLVNTDDGMRIFIDNIPVYNKWYLGPKNDRFVIFIPAGTRTVKVEYNEALFTAKAIVSWKRISN